MPLVILSQAAEATAARASKQPNDRFYDCEILRDFCGCLIHVNTKTKGVTFAHYTVQEYLNRTHIFQGISEKLNIPFFLEFMFVETLRIHQEDLNTHEHDFQHESCAIDTQFNGDLHIYCAVSSILSLNQWTDRIEQGFVSLVVNILDPSKSHISALRNVLNLFSTNSLGWPSEDFWMVEWGRDGDTNSLGVMHLLNIVFAVRDITTALVLTEHILRNKSFGYVDFESKLILTIRPYKPDGNIQQFSGTIMDILAQMTSQERYTGCPVIFNYLLQENLAKGCEIVIYIGSHIHDDYCEDFCALDHLLSAGGDPNGSGYRITPLQIAVFADDWHGIDKLLKAGADPNGTGDRSGRVWKDEEILSLFNQFTGASPLRILRNPGSGSSELKSKIENVLLQYGARDFLDELEEVTEDVL
jgi:hypothetical protein